MLTILPNYCRDYIGSHDGCDIKVIQEVLNSTYYHPKGRPKYSLMTVKKLSSTSQGISRTNWSSILSVRTLYIVYRIILKGVHMSRDLTEGSLLYRHSP